MEYYKHETRTEQGGHARVGFKFCFDDENYDEENYESLDKVFDLIFYAYLSCMDSHDFCDRLGDFVEYVRQFQWEVEDAKQDR